MSAYAELAVTTNFSFLRGASHPREMVATADALGLTAIGIADRNSFAGVVRAYDEWKRTRAIKLLVGTRLVTIDGFEVLAYPTDRPAYGRLCQLLTKGNLKAKKGECHLTFEEILGASEGQILIALPPRRCSRSAFTERLAALARAAPGRTFLAGVHYHRGDEPRRLGFWPSSASARRAARRRQRCLLSRAGATAARRRAHLHPREMHHCRSRPSACRQCRAASQARRRNGAAVRRISRRHRPHHRDRQCLPLLARRIEIRISRRAGAAGQDRPAASRRSDLGRCRGALSQGAVSERHSPTKSRSGCTRNWR